MKKAVYNINIPYTFDPAHKGAPYSLNGGESWTNGGELKEGLFKACMGFEAKKDACGAYDKTDDVPELCASFSGSIFRKSSTCKSPVSARSKSISPSKS